MRLAGKRALVTAAGNGIGRAIAQVFEREGAHVFALDRDPDTLRDFTQGITLDLTVPDGIERLRETTGPLDILVNAAGVVHAGTVTTCSMADWDLAWSLNVTSTFRAIRTYLPDMAENRSGSIINIASVASSLIGVRDRCAYGATKAAVIGLTKSVAADYVATGVRCNAICPGTVETPSLLERAHAVAERDGLSFEETYADFAARQPIGRLGRADEIAALAVHLASDESAFTTGTTAVIDGGWTLL